MSKKLIAVASAAALALSALVAVPASAAAFSVDVDGSVDNAALATDGDTALEINVPSSNVLRYNTDSTSTASAIRFTVNTTDDSKAVAATSTGGVKIVTGTQLAAAATTTATGTSSVSITSDSDAEAVFYVYNTSTDAGTVTFAEGSTNSKTFYVAGVTHDYNAYKLNATLPTSAALGEEVELSATIVDMFGNAVEDSADLPVLEVLGGDSAVATVIAWDGDTDTYVGEFTNRDDAGTVAISITLPAGTYATKVTAFGSVVASAFGVVSAADLAEQVKTLTAQVATLTASVTALTADYNKLAARWNAKVANKKTLKKKVALK
jgi:hypothetical protein